MREVDKLNLAEETELVEGLDYGGGYGQAEAVQSYAGMGGLGGSGMGISIGLTRVRQASCTVVGLLIAPYPEP